MADSLEDLSPEQIAHLRQRNALLDGLLTDPETRKQTLRLLKKKNPTMNVPEIDAEEAVTAALAADRAEREAENKLRAEQRAQDAVRDQRRAVVALGLISEAEIPDLEKFMQDNEVVSYEKAARLYRTAKKAEVATARPDGGPGVDLPTGKGLWRNPVKYAREQAALAVNDILAAH
jgi:hypothetical protein